MRIALVSRQYPPATLHGGIGTQTHAKAHGLAALGHDVVVVAESVDATQHERRDGPVRVVRIPGFGDRLDLATEIADWTTWSAEVAAALATVHAEEPLDLVDVPEYGCEGFVWLLNQAEWNRVPTLVHLHGPLVMLAHAIGWPDVDSDLYRVGTAMEEACLRAADVVYSSSRLSAQWCARSYGLPLEDAPVVHTGVDCERFRPRDEGADRPTVVFAGRLAPSKGVDVLVDAASQLAGEVVLRLLGRGDEVFVDSLRRRAHDAGLRLELPGFVEPERLPDELARAHVFAAPSLYEGGPGLVYLEAMASGLPVIACSGSGVEEIVTDGENGLLVPPGDVEALAVSLDRLLSDEAQRGAMGRRAREYVESEADTRSCARRLEALYETVVAAAPR